MFPDIGLSSCGGSLQQTTKRDLRPSPARDSYTWLFLLKAEHCCILKRYKRVFPNNYKR